MLVCQQERDELQNAIPQTQEDPINVMAWMQLKGCAGCEKQHLFQCFEFLREVYMHPDYGIFRGLPSTSVLHNYMNICIYFL